MIRWVNSVFRLLPGKNPFDFDLIALISLERYKLRMNEKIKIELDAFRNNVGFPLSAFTGIFICK